MEVRSVEDWAIQTPEQILQEVRRFVSVHKHGGEELDEQVLDRRRHHDRSDRMDRGYHIILPDNRVRTMEDQLSRRVRAQLLDEELEPGDKGGGNGLAEKKSPSRRREDRPRPAPRTPRVRNPWYLPAKSWYSRQPGLEGGTARGACSGFPYDSRILRRTGGGVAGLGKSEEEGDETGGGAKPLTQTQKETLGICEAYRQYSKKENQRLPHFLQ